MHDAQEIADLRAKIAELEARNRELQSADLPASSTSTPLPNGKLRSASALMLVSIAALLAPVAVLGSWVHGELVDTNSFVQTFAPLAQEPEVQAFVADEVAEAIKQNVDIDGMVGDLFGGIAALDLPPRATAVLPLLEGSAASGVRSLIDSGVTTAIESPQFAGAWEAALRESHSRAIALIQGEPNSVMQLSNDGTISLNLAAITRQVKSVLTDQGFGFAQQIPEIDRAIPLASSESFVTVRTVYQLAVGLGFWLPWVAFASLVAGLLVSRNRVRTLKRAGIGIAASLLLALMGLGIGKMLFIGAVSPSVMPAPTAEVLFNQLTELIVSTMVALIVLFIAVAIGGWLVGASKRAVAVRSALSSGFNTARRAADKRGIGTGAFGMFLDRWHSAILVVSILGAVFALFFMRPITGGGVVAVVLILLGVLLGVELLRRPAEPVDAESPVETAETGTAEFAKVAEDIKDTEASEVVAAGS